MSEVVPTRVQPAGGPTPTDEENPSGSTVLRPALAGAVGALAGIGVSELVAGFLGGPSLLAAIGEWLIDHQPPGAKDFVVGLFGTNDKLAFEILIVAIAAGIGALLGLAAVRWSFAIAATGFGVFAIAGFFAALGSPSSSPTTALVVPLVAAVVGIQTMSFLLGTATKRSPGTRGGMPSWSRRSFLLQAGGIAVASTAVGVLGRRMLEGGLGGLTGGGPAAGGG